MYFEALEERLKGAAWGQCGGHFTRTPPDPFIFFCSWFVFSIHLHIYTSTLAIIEVLRLIPPEETPAFFLNPFSSGGWEVGP